jgi:predicted PurR-regulated permease PerM
MFETSKDILNLSLTLAVVVLTFFIAWILYYIVSIFREVKKVIRDITGVIKKFNNVLDFAKEKISNAAAVMPLIIKGGEKIAQVVNSVRDKKTAARSKKNKKKSGL